jgi:zinc and cadmium transporter
MVYAIISVVIVSLLSVAVVLPLFAKKKLPDKLLVFLLSVSVGVLLSTVFLDFLPETLEHGYHTETALIILGGFLAMFILEKFVHWHHSKKAEECQGHGHAYSVAPINLIGDGIHNFLDGLVIAGAYAVNVGVGVAATISVIFHEIPQEMADFGVLLYSGLSKIRALLFNFISALTAILGAVVGILLAGSVEGFTHFIIPFAAGNFLYIAASNLLPQLHRHCRLRDTVYHVAAIVLGVLIIVAVSMFVPHAH